MEKSNAKIRITDFPQEQSLYIQSSLIGENSISWGELAEMENKTAEDLWAELEDVPCDDMDNLDADWYSFPKGTSKFEVWQWFEEAFCLSVAEDLM